MDITTTTDGTLATLAVGGTIDTRASAQFEAALVKAVEGGAKRVIIDFAKLDLVTSAGIRVLVMFAKRLHGAGGGLVMCALTPDVRRVFDIAGLSGQFKIVGTRDEAAAMLRPVGAAPAQPKSSKVSRLVGALLGSDSDRSSEERSGGAASRSALSTQVARLLDSPPKKPHQK